MVPGASQSRLATSPLQRRVLHRTAINLANSEATTVRFRERDQRFYTPSSMTRSRLGHSDPSQNGSAQIAYQNGPWKIGSYESMVDNVTPRFHERSGKGEVIINPMVKTKQELIMTPGGFSFRNNPGGSNDFTDTYDGFYAIDRKGGPAHHLPVSINLQELHTLAGTQAASAVDEPIFEATIFVAELREAIAFLRNPVKGYVDFLKYCKRMKREKAQRSGLHHLYQESLYDFLASNWLAYRYGVRPLLYDAQDAMKAIESLAHVAPKRKTARGSASASGHDANSFTASQYAANVKVQTFTSRDVSVRAGILYEIYRDPDTFGKSIRHVPAAAYEMLLFSFIVEWFANIGSWLRAIVPKVGTRQLGSWTTTQDKQTSRTTSYVASLDDGGDDILNPGHCLEDLRTETKTRSAGVETGITFKSQNFNQLNLGVERIDDLLSIARQLLSSR